MSSERIKSIPTLSNADLERFWSKVDKSSNCWIWLASLTKGYGQFKINGTMYLSHRVSYTLANEDPGEFCVCHTCDNPKCVNPAHLWVGTHVDNIVDKISKNRQSKGETHGKSTLTEKQVKEILESDELNQVLAIRYDISQQTIWDIKGGRKWKHIERTRKIDAAQENSQTGVRGVSPHGNRYHAKIMSKGVLYYLGSFKTVSQAEQAVIKKRLELKA